MMAATARKVGLTRRMQDCLQVIDQYIREHGHAPSHDDIRLALNLKAKSGVVRLVDSLEERGWIKRGHNLTRSISIVASNENTGAPPQYGLPPVTQELLERFCAANGEDPAAIVADAVALFLDDAGEDASE